MDQYSKIKQALSQGQLSQAISMLDDALKNIEGSSQQALVQRNELLYLQTVAYRLNQQPKLALESANTLLESNPNYGRIYQELGYIHQGLNQTLQAANAFYQATKRNPALLASWNALVKLYAQLGNTEAQKIAQHQVDYLSKLPKAIAGARDLMYEGKLDAADKICRQFLQQQKHHTEALLLLAEIGIQLKVYGEAEFILESSLELHPEHLATGIEYLKLLSKMGKFQQAKVQADKLLIQYPEHTQIQTMKATALVGIGETQEAIKLYESMLQGNIDQPGVHLLLGHALKAQGQFQQAIVSYQNAYQYKPDFGDAYWSLANTKTYRFTEDEVTKMKTLLKKESTNTDDKIHLHFALAKSQEDSQQYHNAFVHYQAGNQLKNTQLGYDPDIFDRQVEAQIKHCTPELFAQFPNAGCINPAPIFIVGLPRAGSTLLEQILASHAQVDGTMELHNIMSLAARLMSQSPAYPANLGNVAPEYWQQFGQQYIEETKVFRAGASFFVDKMPNNFLHIGLIKLILPNAKIIDARRHPMACCFSGFKQLFGEGQEFTYSLENIARYYNAYLKLMKHWDEVLPGFVLKVQHEEVIEDLHGQVNRILNFCDLPFDENCLTFYNTQRTIKTPSSEQVRQPIYRSGMELWKHFEQHLSTLSKALQVS